MLEEPGVTILGISGLGGDVPRVSGSLLPAPQRVLCLLRSKIMHWRDLIWGGWCILGPRRWTDQP